MNVLIVEPGKAPYESQVETLEDMQRVVGGTIQAVYPYEEPVALVCNDEAKLLNLPLNRALYQDGQCYEIISGTFFVCGLGEDNFASLPPELMDKFKGEYAMAEYFLMVGDELMVFSAQPEEREVDEMELMDDGIGNDYYAWNFDPEDAMEPNAE